MSIAIPVEGRTAEVVIRDDGPGFRPGSGEAAFEPGMRGIAARNEAAPPGTGLDLALARRLARANGGDVSIPVSGDGGTVILTVPASRVGA